MTGLLAALVPLVTEGPGELAAALVLVAFVVVLLVFIDDDDLPGPRRCFAEGRRA